MFEYINLETGSNWNNLISTRLIYTILSTLRCCIVCSTFWFFIKKWTNKNPDCLWLYIFLFLSQEYILYFDLRITMAWIILWTTYYWLETMADNNRGGSSTNEITYYLNIENAKILAFCIVCGFVMYHGVLHLKYGKLLNDGLYKFPNVTPSSYNVLMLCS